MFSFDLFIPYAPSPSFPLSVSLLGKYTLHEISLSIFLNIQSLILATDES